MGSGKRLEQQRQAVGAGAATAAVQQRQWSQSYRSSLMAGILPVSDCAAKDGAQIACARQRNAGCLCRRARRAQRWAAPPCCSQRLAAIATRHPAAMKRRRKPAPGLLALLLLLSAVASAAQPEQRGFLQAAVTLEVDAPRLAEEIAIGGPPVRQVGPRLRCRHRPTAGPHNAGFSPLHSSCVAGTALWARSQIRAMRRGSPFLERCAAQPTAELRCTLAASGEPCCCGAVVQQ